MVMMVLLVVTIAMVGVMVVTMVLTLCGPREREILRGLHLAVGVRDGVCAVVAPRQEMGLGHDAFAAIVRRNLLNIMSMNDRNVNMTRYNTLNAPTRIGASLPWAPSEGNASE